MVFSIQDLKVKIFADGADLNTMFAMYEKPYIKGLILILRFDCSS